MFDALLKSKFYSRCKSEMKLTNKRIEIIKRKRKAMQKFLRNDIADLLNNGLDSNAYGRVEGLYGEQNLTSCYEFVEQSCSLILGHLSAMNKQRECPEECKEAISSLIFAAARFADLPELREVRSLFAERYGNCLEPYVNQEFVKKLKADPPTNEMKLQMMQEIALECGIEWDSKALEQELYKPSPFVQDHSQYANERSHKSLKTRHQNDLGINIQETENEHSKKQTEVAKKDHTLGNGLPYKSRAEVEKKEEEHKDQSAGNGLCYEPRDEVEKKDERRGHGRVSSYWSSNASSSGESTTSPEYSTGPDDSASEDIPERRKFHPFKSMAPPYIKTDSSKKATCSDISSGFGREEEVAGSKCKNDNLQSASEDIPEGRKLYGFRSMAPPYIKTDLSKKATLSDTSSGSGKEKVAGSNFNLQSASEDIPEGRKFYGFKSMAPPYTKTALEASSGSVKEKVSGSNCKDDNLQHEESANITKPVPRSMRIRRPLKPESGSHRNNEASKQSLKFSNGEDEEEKKMDKLLSHYSRKPSNLPCDSSIVNREVDGPTRAGSLPHEHLATPAAATEERKGLARAATYQPDSGPSPRGHVHPKLPDYDDFVARLAAFRASS